MISDLIGLSSNGKIQFLGNTGSLGTDSWGKIGLKVERLIADGFEFDKNIYFYRDRNLGEMKINNDGDKFGNNGLILPSIEEGLNNINLIGSDFVDFSINGETHKLTFIPVGFID